MFDGLEMSLKVLSFIVHVTIGKRDIMICCCHRLLKFTERCLEVVEKELEERIRKVANVNELRTLIYIFSYNYMEIWRQSIFLSHRC